MKRFLGLLALVALTGCVVPHQVKAQFIGYTSPQTVTSIPFNGATCTAALAAGTIPVTNIGQGAHAVTLTNANVTSLTYTIQGSYDGVTFFDISDVGTYTVNSSGLTGLTGTGYYPVIGVRVGACLPAAGTVTLKYAGISLTPGAPMGTNQVGQLVKNIAVLAAANTTLVTNVLRSPFGSSAGTLQFVYVGGAGPSGSTLTVQCGSNAAFLTTIAGPFTLQTASAPAQTFQIPANTCPFFIVTYTSGGASAVNFHLDYTFAPPGAPPVAYQFTHITGTTATAIKNTAGVVHTVSINTGGAGTLSLFDLASAACTGTPSTNTVAVITAVAGTLQTFTYDANFLNGICAKASVALDVTVSSQ